MTRPDKQRFGKIADPVVPADLCRLLKKVGTCTVCNANVQGKCGSDAFAKGTMQCTASGQSMVGFVRDPALTARVS